ncbi:MAG: protein-L-isoaspartate O-methyltransferase [Micavibrio sp.]
MTDFATARQSMVDSQIHPLGVVNDAVLEAFGQVAREDFLPEGARGIAYCDEDIALGGGRWMMEPATHARLLQAASPEDGDRVLDIGGGSGYSAALLARLCAHITALEPDTGLMDAAQAIWARLGCAAVIAPVSGPFAQGHAAGAPYNLIFVNGAVGAIPPELVAQLAPEGRLAAVVRKAGEKIGRATLVTKNANGIAGERILFDAAIHYLPGMEPQTGFVF